MPSIAIHAGVKTDLMSSLSLARKLMVYTVNAGEVMKSEEGCWNPLWGTTSEKAMDD